jgi:ABC-type transport system involved in cytochrome c biogenesis permease component
MGPQGAVNERGLRVLLSLQAVVCAAVGIWGVFLTPVLTDVLGLDVPSGANGLAHLFGVMMLAFAVGYALAAAQPHRSRGFLVPLFLVPLLLAVALIVNVAQHEVAHSVRAVIFAIYNLAYCLFFFRVYPRVPDAPRT